MIKTSRMTRVLRLVSINASTFSRTDLTGLMMKGKIRALLDVLVANARPDLEFSATRGSSVNHVSRISHHLSNFSESN
jgi:hypothetical protein